MSKGVNPRLIIAARRRDRRYDGKPAARKREREAENDRRVLLAAFDAQSADIEAIRKQVAGLLAKLVRTAKAANQ